MVVSDVVGSGSKVTGTGLQLLGACMQATGGADGFCAAPNGEWDDAKYARRTYFNGDTLERNQRDCQQNKTKEMMLASLSPYVPTYHCVNNY